MLQPLYVSEEHYRCCFTATKTVLVLTLRRGLIAVCNSGLEEAILHVRTPGLFMQSSETREETGLLELSVGLIYSKRKASLA